jgi:hypothetical protein
MRMASIRNVPKRMIGMQLRGGIMINDWYNKPRYAVRRPIHGVEPIEFKEGFNEGKIYYIPPGLPGHRPRVGVPVYDDPREEAKDELDGNGKPKGKTSKAKCT